jgi:UDP-2,3-diacylglucosamine hydrolase
MHPNKNQVEVWLAPHKKIYFASDFHLGAPSHAESLVRERRIVAWLDGIKTDAQVICLVGDLFDFWIEYRRFVPRGFVRLFGKLAELSDAGIQIMVFPGNHDLWMTDYFETELNIKTYRKPLNLSIFTTLTTTQDSAPSTNFYITHGDGLGPGDYSYKFLKQIFESRVAQWAFRNLLHPHWALTLGQAWATHSWQKHAKEDPPSFMGEAREWLLLYAKDIENQTHHDYYVFGHRHILLDMAVNDRSRTLILGDWIAHFSYAVFDGSTMQLLTQKYSDSI